MKLRVLGCHGPYPCAGGATSGYLMEHGGKTLLMDCGAGVLGRLMALEDPASLEAVLLSHLHFDHASDMLVLRYYLERMGKTLPVYVPGEDQGPIRPLMTSPAFDVRPYPEALRLMDLTVTSLPVNHSVPCRALRFTDGEKTLVFTGDTALCPPLADFAREADVLLADSAFLDGEWSEKAPHLSARLCGELAAQAGAKRLYLTHLAPRHAPEAVEKEAAAYYPGAKCVHPGMVIQL